MKPSIIVCLVCCSVHYGFVHCQLFIALSIVQDPSGRVIEKHSIVLKEEESVVIQQFLRFSETRSISQELLAHEMKSLQVRAIHFLICSISS